MKEPGQLAYEADCPPWNNTRWEDLRDDLEGHRAVKARYATIERAVRNAALEEAAAKSDTMINRHGYRFVVGEAIRAMKETEE